MSHTLMNLYKFLGFVCGVLRPMVARFPFPCISGNDVALEDVLDTSGRIVVPVL